jgi:hypothetical protein
MKLSMESMRSGTWLIYALPETGYFPDMFPTASSYTFSGIWGSCIYQSAWKAARNHPLCKDPQYILDNVGHPNFDFTINEWCFLFALHFPLSAVEEELEELRRERPEGLPLIVFPGTAESYTLAMILHVAPEPIPGLDEKCIWGDGPYPVHIDGTE